uniref:(northern house mosquito) hypothetical protein n=1 Tax=Culex pipiens TaxID=7175 RepID=A0A8D8DVZ5_CULPI
MLLLLLPLRSTLTSRRASPALPRQRLVLKLAGSPPTTTFPFIFLHLLRRRKRRRPHPRHIPPHHIQRIVVLLRLDPHLHPLPILTHQFLPPRRHIVPIPPPGRLISVLPQIRQVPNLLLVLFLLLLPLPLVLHVLPPNPVALPALQLLKEVYMLLPAQPGLQLVGSCDCFRVYPPLLAGLLAQKVDFGLLVGQCDPPLALLFLLGGFRFVAANARDVVLVADVPTFLWQNVHFEAIL